MKTYFRVIICTIFSVFLGGFSALADEANAEIKLNDLLNTSWTLVSITNDKGEVVLMDDYGITLAINEKGNISGKAGVNRYFGSISVVDGKLSWSPIGYTKMAGPPENMAAEILFLKSLPLTTTFEIVDDMVTFSDAITKTKFVLKAVAK
jgi:heat shock protein HslJ